MQSSKNDLIFVYNADSGLFNMMIDWAHKIIKPATYDCQLCKLTYGNTGMRKQWQAFTSSLPLATLFLHKDQFNRQYTQMIDTKLPCILIDLKNDNTRKILVDADTLNEQQTLDQLIDTCKTSFESYIQQKSI
jgi:hypothetical protein